ncbi:MAG: Gfo/Idh/MocA family oxidoreductase [Acidobacteria bacterium]|nr:Gfo/Idh/MocA family oxidoreductase [Acidobacteriota bacterium]
MISNAASLRAGIVGAGLMGRWHAEAVRKAGGQVSAVADLNLNLARRLAAGYHNARSFSDVGKMLNETDLDVLHICSPLSTHRSVAEQAIAAGVNLLIEKPLTPTAAETVHLYTEAAERGVLICPVHQFIFQDGALKAKELLSQIGQLVHISAVTCSAGGAGLPLEQLDIIAADILPHPLSLMQIFLSDVLSERHWEAVRPRCGELRISSEVAGTTLSIFISMNGRPITNSFQIIGRNGTIHLNLFHGYAFMEPGTVSRARKIAHPFESALRSLSAATINLGRRTARAERAYPGLQRLVVSFYHALQTKSPPPITPEDTIAIARVRDSLIHSAEFVKREREYVRS